MHILIAPNAFKNVFSAGAAAEAIFDGLTQSRLSFTGECFPIGDGGDGTGEILIEKMKAVVCDVTTQDPLGKQLQASFGLSGTDTAIIEMASASGLRLLSPREFAPLRASSAGTGDLIRAALDKGARRILLGIGGSATIDGGIGILYALGVRFFDVEDRLLPPEPGRLAELERIDLSGLDPQMHDATIIVLCDVDNPLLGPTGTAAVFGPQKGATPGDIAQLEVGLTHFRNIVLTTTGKDMAAVRYGGAAGGVAAGLYALLDAHLVNGADHFFELTGFDASLEKADLVITGEGSIDGQTLQGKGPFAVAQRARRYRVPVIGLAGSIPLIIDPAYREYFDILLPIGNRPAGLPDALRATAANLTRTAMAVGDLLALRTK